MFDEPCGFDGLPPCPPPTPTPTPPIDEPCGFDGLPPCPAPTPLPPPPPPPTPPVAPMTRKPYGQYERRYTESTTRKTERQDFGTNYCPLILDLDGDGIETVGQDAGVYFNHNKDEFRSNSGFVGKDDGLLVLDRNNDGVINDGGELFGDNTKLENGRNASNGFQALAELDDDGDGVVNGNDALFDKLRIFKDLDQDGETDAGELFTLDELGVASLSTDYEDKYDSVTGYAGTKDENNNEHRQVGSFTTTSGEERTMTDVWFANSNTLTQTANLVEVSDDIAALPDAIGYGEIHSLHQAMARDESGQLQGFVEDIIAADTYGQIDGLLEQSVYALSNQSTTETSLTVSERYLAKTIDHYHTTIEFTRWMNYRNGVYLNTTGYFQTRYERRLQYTSYQYSSFTKLNSKVATAIEAYSGNNVGYESYIGGNSIPVMLSAFRDHKEALFYQIAAQTRLKFLFDEMTFKQDSDDKTLYIANFDKAIPVLFEKLAQEPENASNLMTEFTTAIRGLNAYNQINMRGLYNGILGYISDNDLSDFPSDVLETTVNIAHRMQGFLVDKDSYANENAWWIDKYRYSPTATMFSLDIEGGGTKQLGLSGNDVLIGTSEVDFLDGGSGSDTLYGREGDDALDGGSGNDRLYGEAGDDRLTGGEGADQLRGGDGNDLIEGNEGNDALYGENGDDELAGGSGNDSLNGGNDNDTLNGGVGNDTLYAGYGNDVLNGGEGDDRLYGQYGENNLSGGQGRDYLYGGVGAELLQGGEGNDYLYGGNGDDVLQGGADDDYLRGDNGSDRYVFGLGDGQDQIVNYSASTAYTDVLQMDELNLEDVTFVKTGNHLKVLINESDDNVTIQNWFSHQYYRLDEIQFEDTTVNGVDVTSLVSAIHGSVGNDTIYGGIEDDNILGFAGSDTLYGRDGNDRLAGDEGNDRLYGENGDDALAGGSGNDFLNGGNDNDTLIGGVGNDTLYAGYGNDMLNGGEGDDRLYGQYGENNLSGGQGRDYLYGGVGAELLQGGEGNDYLYGGNGDDVLQGGADDDYLRGDNGSDRYVFGLGDGQDQIVNYSTSAAYTDVLQMDGLNLEDVTFVKTGNHLKVLINQSEDDITIQNWFSNQYYRLDEIQFEDTTVNGIDATSLVSAIHGSVGNDTIYGGIEDDNILGLAGNDRIYGRDGNDRIEGNEGNDSLYGENGDDALEGGSGNDFLNGGNDNDTLNGGVGNDTLYAGYGNDVLNGGEGDDRLYGQYGENNLSGGQGRDYFYGGVGAELLQGGEGNDYLYGGNGDDVLQGGADDDYLRGDNGSDRYVFGLGDGQDQIVNYSASTAYTDVLQMDGLNLEDVTFVKTGNHLKVLINESNDNVTVQNWFSHQYYRLDEIQFEDTTVNGVDATSLVSAIHGSVANDTIYGAAEDDNILGLAGSDRIYGRDGNDTLAGNEGNDALYGENDNDTLNGGVGNDTLYAGYGNDVLNGGEGDDRLYGQYGENNLSGGQGRDYLYGGVGAELLQGGEGNDYIYGGNGDDVLQGGADDDYLRGDNGSDRYVFGLGDGQDQIVNYSTSAAYTDVLQMDGLNLEDVTFVKTGNHLKVLINESDDNVTIQNWFSHQYYRLDEIQFEDTTVNGVDATSLVSAIHGSVANDTIYGAAEDDNIQGLAGSDRIYGRDGNDTLAGNEGNDALYGENDNDTLNGGIGNDTLSAGNGDDSLYGDAGNDRLFAGNGSDYANGGEGSDTYYFYKNQGNLVIDNSATDNTTATDRLNIYGVYANDVEMHRSDDDLVFEIKSSGELIVLKEQLRSDGGASIDSVYLSNSRLLWDTAELSSMAPELIDGENSSIELPDDLNYGVTGDTIEGQVDQLITAMATKSTVDGGADINVNDDDQQNANLIVVAGGIG